MFLSCYQIAFVEDLAAQAEAEYRTLAEQAKTKLHQVQSEQTDPKVRVLLSLGRKVTRLDSCSHTASVCPMP